jgi:hypothetical protein
MPEPRRGVHRQRLGVDRHTLFARPVHPEMVVRLTTA